MQPSLNNHFKEDILYNTEAEDMLDRQGHSNLRIDTFNAFHPGTIIPEEPWDLICSHTAKVLRAFNRAYDYWEAEDGE